jgi:hypothetical protein
MSDQTSGTVERVTRRVSGLYVQYRDQRESYDGKPREVLRRAVRGAEVSLPRAEADRLDSLGMLAPEGSSAEDVARTVRATQDSVAAAMGRALTMPEAVAIAAAPMPSVTPPPLGAAPVGDFTTGDTGAPDTVPPVEIDFASGTGLPAPDPATASIDEIAAYIEAESPTVPDTVALAGDDPSTAAKVLEAERVATSGDPRAGVEKALSRLADGSGS